jgi:hypothetical protein
MQDQAAQPQENTLSRNGQHYRWDDVTSGWVRDYRGHTLSADAIGKALKDAKTNDRDQVRYQTGGILSFGSEGVLAVRFAKNEQGVEYRTDLPNRHEIRRYIALQRNVHVDPLTGHKTGGTRSKLKKVARAKFEHDAWVLSQRRKRAKDKGIL